MRRLPFLIAVVSPLFFLASCTEDAAQIPTALIAEGEVGSKLRLADRKVEGEYIVVLKSLPAFLRPAETSRLLRTYGGTIKHTYTNVLSGFSAKLSRTQALALARDEAVAYVQENRIVTKHETQINAPWGLDRIDQRSLPLSTSYNYLARGQRVHVYVVDTGIRATHSEFEGRIGNWVDTVNDGQNGSDCDGHGTHVAGVIGGKTYGVAKGVTLHSVRVLNCRGEGYDDEIIAALDWVAINHVKPAVANMSLGGGGVAEALDQAVRNTISSGVTFVLSAGNSNSEACKDSPTRTREAIVVGAASQTDERAWFSNWGQCVDIFAPGVKIISADIESDTATKQLDGTSQAAPHVAGAAALYLSTNPLASPEQVAAALLTKSLTANIVGQDNQTPNKLLYAGFIGAGGELNRPSASLSTSTLPSSIFGRVALTASATDDVGVTSVEFYADKKLIGTASQSPYEISWDSTWSKNGSVNLFARAYDAEGNIGDSIDVLVTVANPNAAEFDSALLVPACHGERSACDSGGQFAGVGIAGPEMNAPNTLGSTCADGKDGSYRFDESIEAIDVETTSGRILASGEEVRIDVTVWSWKPADDFVDVYYAADAVAPNWQLVGTFKPSASGLGVISAKYVIPSGGGVTHAVRAAIRFRGSARSCAPNRFDDNDDLAFDVAP